MVKDDLLELAVMFEKTDYKYLHNNEIVGTVALKIDEIDDLIVNRKYQGKGYGKQILLWAIKNIQTQKPILHVAGWNEKAVDE